MPFNFPTLPGLAWSVHKKPSFSMRVASHVSGREVRAPFYSAALYEFELVIEGMDSGGTFPALGAKSLQALMGLYIQCQGQFGTFLYIDPSDNSVTKQVIGIGDGRTTTFPLLRSLGAVTEPAPGGTSNPIVYLNGIAQSLGWSLTSANAILFTVPPAASVVVTATFTYAFNCRFLDDQEDFEEFMNRLWQVQSLKFRSTKPATPFFLTNIQGSTVVTYADLIGTPPTTDPGNPGTLWSDGGEIVISGWTSPYLIMPTSPPFAVGQLWSDNGALSISGWTDASILLPSTLPTMHGVWWNNRGQVSFS